MKYIRKISLPALLRYNFGDQSEAVRQDVKARGRCDVRYIRSTISGVYAHFGMVCVFLLILTVNGCYISAMRLRRKFFIKEKRNIYANRILLLQKQSLLRQL